MAVALALGMGTMVGWKRIVVTVGEKIGKEHLTYAQGATAELVAMATIFAADNFGLPVSTTHVLSSGVAGTMAANRSGLQMSTHPQYRRGVGIHSAGGGAALRIPVLAVSAISRETQWLPLSGSKQRASGHPDAFSFFRTNQRDSVDASGSLVQYHT